MKINVTNGQRTIVLTKSEINAVKLARSVCEELATTAHPDAREAADRAADGLVGVILRYCPVAAQPEPAAATTKAV